MPPHRTTTLAKATKTERTHEENQERAYIAASRRSDRSLEARIESARRASEIHKKRTGRSFRVTEQDVINEDMYEEEDDDVPIHLRRLTQHLQTGSPQFNQRLAAYLQQQIAMRNYIEQTQLRRHTHQPMANHGQQGMVYPTSFAQNGTQDPMFQTANMGRTSFQHVPTPYQQQPYPIPGQYATRPHPHARSVSISTLEELTGNNHFLNRPSGATSHYPEARRTSLATLSTPSSSTIQCSPANISNSPALHEQYHSLSFYNHQRNSPLNTSSITQDSSPLTNQLPQESQQLLAPAYNACDPMTAGMIGADTLCLFHNNSNASSKSSTYNNLHFVNPTLAPQTFIPDARTTLTAGASTSISTPTNDNFNFDANDLFGNFDDQKCTFQDSSLFLDGIGSENQSGNETPGYDPINAFTSYGQPGQEPEDES
ncbi:MAG: hypothetical protein M1834_008689 [Cirrosporium novae-zelandiae]|nr:MAG: hypothetical protein M1834_008689 [Cirrosporium novae-zelandiae]